MSLLTLDVTAVSNLRCHGVRGRGFTPTSACCCQHALLIGACWGVRIACMLCEWHQGQRRVVLPAPVPPYDIPCQWSGRRRLCGPDPAFAQIRTLCFRKTGTFYRANPHGCREDRNGNKLPQRRCLCQGLVPFRPVAPSLRRTRCRAVRGTVDLAVGFPSGSNGTCDCGVSSPCPAGTRQGACLEGATPVGRGGGPPLLSTEIAVRRLLACLYYLRAA